MSTTDPSLNGPDRSTSAGAGGAGGSCCLARTSVSAANRCAATPSRRSPWRSGRRSFGRRRLPSDARSRQRGESLADRRVPPPQPVRIPQRHRRRRATRGAGLAIGPARRVRQQRRARLLPQRAGRLHPHCLARLLPPRLVAPSAQAERCRELSFPAEGRGPTPVRRTHRVNTRSVISGAARRRTICHPGRCLTRSRWMRLVDRGRQPSIAERSALPPSGRPLTSRRQRQRHTAAERFAPAIQVEGRSDTRVKVQTQEAARSARRNAPHHLQGHLPPRIRRLEREVRRLVHEVRRRHRVHRPHRKGRQPAMHGRRRRPLGARSRLLRRPLRRSRGAETLPAPIGAGSDVAGRGASSAPIVATLTQGPHATWPIAVSPVPVASFYPVSAC